MRYTYEQPEYIDRVGVAHLVKQLKIYIDGIATGDIDLSDYVTKAELQAKLDALDINIDLSAYATKEELTNALRNIDLSSYATKEYVTDAINNAQLGGDGSSVDLSIYAKKSDLDSKANTNHTHTMSDITDYTAPDLSSYAKKTDIPSLSGYATKTYVDQNKFSGSYNDLTDKPTIPSIDGLATTEYVDNAVANVPTTDLTNYYTKAETYSKTEVDTAISNIEGGEPTKDLLYESVIRQGGALKSSGNTLENYYGANSPVDSNTISYANEYITKGQYIYNEPEKILTHSYDMYGSEVEEGGYTEEEKAQHSIEFANKLIREEKYKGVFAIKCTSDAVEHNYNDAWLTNDDLVIGKPLYVYGYVLNTFCGLSQGAYILKVIPSGTVMKKTDIVKVIPVTKERVKVPCNLSLVNHLSMFSTGESPHYKKQWKQYDTSRRCTDRERNEVITFPKGNDDSEFVLSRFGYPQYTITNGVPQGIVLQGVDYGTSSGCYLISKGLERETYVSGNTDSIIHYSLDEWAKKIDDAISNVDVKADLPDYQYEPQKYKYEYLNIYGTKLDIEMPQLPTFDGGTVLHITPPDGWSNFINAENDCMTVYVKKDKDREYIDVMNDDIIYNVDSEGHATPTLTIPNTTAGFLDNYIIRGTQYVPNGGTVSFQSKQKGWLYDYQNGELGGGYTKWSTDHFTVNNNGGGIDTFKLTFDTSKRTGSVTFNLSDGHEWYINRPSGGVIRKGSSVTVDVTNVDTYSVYIPVGTDDNSHMTLPDYTITYPDEIVSGKFKIWTSDIGVVNTSTQYEFTVNVNQFTDKYYVRYGNEDLVKSIKPIIPTRASELLNDVPFATETYVNEKVAEISTTNGQDGRGIVSTKFLYGYSSTPNTVPTSWSEIDSNLLLGEYRWVKVEITYSDNTTETNYISYVYNGKDGTNGTNGTNGTDGYTPVRGTDYWTQEDINTIKAYIDTELGVIENGSY